MTPTEFEHLMSLTGCSRRQLARRLGYSSETSLRQVEAGLQVLPAAKAEWLRRYARMCDRLAHVELRWHERNPPPL
jgi:hypothetical protein